MKNVRSRWTVPRRSPWRKSRASWRHLIVKCGGKLGPLAAIPWETRSDRSGSPHVFRVEIRFRSLGRHGPSISAPLRITYSHPHRASVQNRRFKICKCRAVVLEEAPRSVEPARRVRTFFMRLCRAAESSFSSIRKRARFDSTSNYKSPISLADITDNRNDEMVLYSQLDFMEYQNIFPLLSILRHL